MPFRIETDPHLLTVLDIDAAAWASAYINQQRHHSGDMRHIELTAWFNAAISAGRKAGMRS